MITIKNKKLKNTTIFKVYDSGIAPVVIEHRNCALTVKDNGKHQVFRYTCTLTDEKGNIITELRCSNKKVFNEIKLPLSFWDKDDAIAIRNEKITEKRKYLSDKIRQFTEQLISMEEAVKEQEK